VKLPLAVGIAALALACGGGDKPAATTPPPPPPVAADQAAPDPGPPSPTNQPGEREDRTALCQRAVDNALQIVQRESGQQMDPKELETSRTQSVKDCAASRSTTQEIDCVVRARSVDDLSKCSQTR
jgi:hypothetical protein